MKIAFFSPTLNVGGYEKVVVAFANYFAQDEGNEVTIICGDSSGKLQEEIIPRVNIVDLHCRTKSLLFKMIMYFRNNRPDVIYSGFRIYNSIILLARQLSGNNYSKILVTQHGYEIQSPIVQFLHGLIQRKADGMVAVTQSLLEYERTSLKLVCPGCVIGNPVIDNRENIERITDPWYENVPVICVCGRLSLDKNITLAINILKRLHEMSYSVKLVILGDGPEKKDLTKLVENYGLNDFVKFEGFVKKPITYMKKCSIYLHTCDKEGFGNTVVEALYANLPVVTTDCGGPVEIIEKGKYGICFGNGRTSKSVDLGAKAIIDILDGKKIYSNLQSRALQYSVDSVSNRLKQFIFEVL